MYNINIIWPLSNYHSMKQSYQAEVKSWDRYKVQVHDNSVNDNSETIYFYGV
jgi:hypothetical protein